MIIREDKKLDITPQTLVGDLLNSYPGLEDIIIEIAPVFKKLKNPILRRTVARVTTLKQAAVVGGVTLSKMINTLRKEAGLDDSDIAEDTCGYTREKPDWVNDNNLVMEYDTRRDLENGIQPAAKVTKDIRRLKTGENYLLITPFIPAPLIQIMENKGFEVFTEKVDEEYFVNYVARKTSE
ncbi:MAG: DUF1858 domain-containing protein [Melioribacteraceae bacterium]|nr:DUF1858 domain-containing protein [Melioribacteraceae bacterium]